jgi:hypothetical protein
MAACHGGLLALATVSSFLKSGACEGILRLDIG